MGSMLFAGVGHALGGPLGAAVAGAVGGVVDGALGSRRRATPVEPGVQTSSYGVAIPRLYGRTRVAGHLIWATSLVARETKNNGARAYTTSLAIALSSRPILGIGRIWADGREIRDAHGQMEQATVMRVYKGDARQKPDPLMVAAEGVGRAPAYHGVAYIVFEELALAPFGNRIPNLTFEVIADDDGLARWLKEMGAEADLAVGHVEEISGIFGYTAREDLATEMQALARIAGVWECLADAEIAFDQGGAEVHLQGEQLLGPVDVGQSGTRWEDNLPSGVQLGYSDPDRAFQGSRQSIMRRRAGPMLDIDTASSMDARTARHLCAQWLRHSECSARRLKIRLSWRFAFLAVGDILIIDTDPVRWRVVERVVQGMLVHIEAEVVAGLRSGSMPMADGGRSLDAPLQPVSPTLLDIFEAPIAPFGLDGGAWVWASGGSGWSGALITFDDGSGERELGWISTPAPSGVLVEPTSAGPAANWDEESRLVVELDDLDLSFESRNADAVLAGANLLKVGEELIQFRSAEMLPEGRMVLRGLLRGRLGTSQAIGPHPAGVPVRLLRPGNLIGLRVSNHHIGREVRCIARGRGDPGTGVVAIREIKGDSFAAVMSPDANL